MVGQKDVTQIRRSFAPTVQHNSIQVGSLTYANPVKTSLLGPKKHLFTQ